MKITVTQAEEAIKTLTVDELIQEEIDNESMGENQTVNK